MAEQPHKQLQEGAEWIATARVITTCHFLSNDASRRVIEKCGFEKREIAPFPSDDPEGPDQDSQWYELKRS